MSLINEYALIYDQPRSYSHLLVLKSEIANRAMQHARSKRMADYLMKEIESIDAVSRKTDQIGSIGQNIINSASNQIKRIHEKTKDIRESKFLYPLNDETQQEIEYLLDFQDREPKVKELIEIFENSPRGKEKSFVITV